MFREAMAVWMAWACLWAPTTAFAAGGKERTPEARMAAVREQVLLISAGTVVRVEFQRKGEKKLVGRLGAVGEESFEVQATKGESIATETLNFSDVKKVEQKGKMRPWAKGLIIGAVVGVACLAAFGILAGTGVLSQ